MFQRYDSGAYGLIWMLRNFIITCKRFSGSCLSVLRRLMYRLSSSVVSRLRSFRYFARSSKNTRSIVREPYLCKWRSRCHCIECPYNTGVAK